MCLALYEEDPSPHRVTPESVRRTLAGFREQPARGQVVVLDAAGHAIGYSFLVSYWSNELRGEICTIDELYVRPEWRRKGHSTQLVETLRSGVGPWSGVPVALELEITPANTKARALYERLGFSVKLNTTLRMDLVG